MIEEKRDWRVALSESPSRAERLASALSSRERVKGSAKDRYPSASSVD